MRLSLRFLNKFYNEPKNINLNQLKTRTIKGGNIIKFNGFRSICPVTSQPDFANIYIYSSDPLSRDWLLSYLTSFKDHGDFHEQCIESIFNNILTSFNPKHLEVAGRFQRRGGIDINPVRGTHKNFFLKILENLINKWRKVRESNPAPLPTTPFQGAALPLCQPSKNRIILC